VALPERFEIASDDDRGRTAFGFKLGRQRIEAISPARRQGHTMTVRGKHPRQFGSYPRRGTSNQCHTLGHDFNALKSNCWCL
jgi:hypothetical protein